MPRQVSQNWGNRMTKIISVIQLKGGAGTPTVAIEYTEVW